ncbi:MAG: amidohydrolase [Bacteroidetes bacterium]|nr:amidohydrolase [Bacteroidota bacterium]
MQFYNSHIHIFTEQDIPNRFLPLALVKVLRTRVGFHFVSRSLMRLNPFTDKDMFDRYVKFVQIGKLGSQRKIFEECRKYYPEGTRFIVLTMDMAFMGAGPVPRPYEDQLKDIYELCKDYPEIIPFLHIDPRRENHYDILRQSVEEYGFQGIKLYPPLGYFPTDERLFPVYEYCTAGKLPVIAHCSPYNPVRFKGSYNELMKLLSFSPIPIETKGKRRKELCSLFTHPLNYLSLIAKFPDLRICFAHFGSEYYWERYMSHPEEEGNWFNIIRSLMEEYDNFYADISFTLNNPSFFPLLKIMLANEKLRKKILFGSDYYMVETVADERRFGIELRAYIGEEYFHTIANDNVERFLNILTT